MRSALRAHALIEPCTAMVSYVLTSLLGWAPSGDMRMREQVRPIPMHFYCAPFTGILSILVCVGAFVK